MCLAVCQQVTQRFVPSNQGEGEDDNLLPTVGGGLAISVVVVFGVRLAVAVSSAKANSEG